MPAVVAIADNRPPRSCAYCEHVALWNPRTRRPRRAVGHATPPGRRVFLLSGAGSAAWPISSAARGGSADSDASRACSSAACARAALPRRELLTRECEVRGIPDQTAHRHGSRRHHRARPCPRLTAARRRREHVDLTGAQPARGRVLAQATPRDPHFFSAEPHGEQHGRDEDRHLHGEVQADRIGREDRASRSTVRAAASPRAGRGGTSRPRRVLRRDARRRRS